MLKFKYDGKVYSYTKNDLHIYITKDIIKIDSYVIKKKSGKKLVFFDEEEEVKEYEVDFKKILKDYRQLSSFYRLNQIPRTTFKYTKDKGSIKSNSKYFEHYKNYLIN